MSYETVVVAGTVSGDFFAEREFVDYASDHIVHSGSFFKKGSMVANWKHRSYTIQKNQQLKYFSPGKVDSNDEKGSLSLAQITIELGSPANVTAAYKEKAGGGGMSIGNLLGGLTAAADASAALNSAHNGNISNTAYYANQASANYPADSTTYQGNPLTVEWVPLTITDFSASPPRNLEVVLDSHAELRKLLLALSRVCGRHNITEFLTSYLSPNNPYPVTNFEEWITWKNMVFQFPRRLAYPNDTVLKSAFCCANLAFYGLYPECCGAAQLLGCCCGEWYCQFGLAKDTDGDQRPATLYDAFTKFCKFDKDGYLRLKDSDMYSKIGKWHDHFCDFKENTCCCHYCEIPFCQCKKREFGFFCKSEANVCCVVERCAIPVDDNIPCEIGCCGILCLDKEALMKDMRKVTEMVRRS